MWIVGLVFVVLIVVWGGLLAEGRRRLSRARSGLDAQRKRVGL